MKKLATLLLAAGLVFGISTGANAVDFKAKGRWIMDFEYGKHGNFVGGKGAPTGFGTLAGIAKEDEFDAEQRLRLTLEAVASENLSGTVQFEIGRQHWGKGGDTNGGALGADGRTVIRVKHAYLDWLVPQTDLKVRMGIQPLALPSFAAGSQIFDTDVAGISLNYQFTENVGLTFFWARPYNDNYAGKTYTDAAGDTQIDSRRAGFLDNVDMFALTLPLTFDGVKVTPFVMYSFLGKNSPGAGTEIGSEGDFYNGGMYPFGGAREKNGDERTRKNNRSGDAWWAGLALDVTALDPLRFALDFNYGATNWGLRSLNRAGWMVNGLVEYKLDWATPGLVAWYASGDDSNPKNGSERMPVVDNNTSDNEFSSFAFNGGPTIAREGVIGTDMTGTWGVGLRLKDMSFVEDLKHTFAVNYIGGTNSPKMVNKLSDYNASRGYRAGNDYFYQNQIGVGNHGLYMTTVDHAVEFALNNQYKIYENLTMLFNMSYLVTSLGHNRIQTVDGGKRASIKDPWNINLQFQYAF